MRVAVIGAGIGGLAAAVGLQQAGAQVEVYERAVELRPVGAGLSLFGNGLTALDALGLGAELRSQAARIGGVRAGQRTPVGRWLATTPASALTDVRVVHRADLQTLLLTALAPGTVACGVEVLGVSQVGDRVELVRDIADADRAPDNRRFDVVVAADGIRSRVRSAWPGDPGLRSAGYSAWRGVTTRPVELGGEAGETWGAGLRFGVAPLVDGRVYWFAVASMPAGTTIDDEYGEVTRLFSGWHPPVAELLEATPASAVFRHDIFDLAAPLRSFRRGRCVLLGDAAHAMTPDLGQGGNQALEDAVTLARLLTPLTSCDDPDPAAVDAALSRYDLLRRTRTQPIARQARRLGRVAQIQGRWPVAVRDIVLRALPAAVTAGSLAQIQDWQPPAIPAEPAAATLVQNRRERAALDPAALDRRRSAAHAWVKDRFSGG